MPRPRKQVLKDLGLPAFRADQLSRHYFTHFEADPANMSDIPAGMRDAVSDALLPNLVTKVVSLEADGGRTIKDLWRLYDGAQVESVLMRYPQRTNAVRLVAGGLRHGVSILCDGTDGPDA